jgi:hypothetical protein
MMLLKKNLALATAVTLVAALATGCSSNKKADPTSVGGVKVAALIGNTDQNIDHVKLTISGGTPSIGPNIVQNLGKTDGHHWSLTVTAIPAASNVTFAVDAFKDAAETVKLFTGQTTATIVANGLAQVYMELAEVNPTNNSVTHVPVVDAMSASAVLVTPGQTGIQLAVTAHSPDSDPLAYQWQDTCSGTFSAATAASTNWTAGTTTGNCQISVRVTDATNKTSVTVFVIIDIENLVTGNAMVNVTANSCPIVSVVMVDEYIVQTGQAPTVLVGAPSNIPANLARGITADVTVNASDPDGDALTYTFSSSCNTATFTPPAASATRFFVNDPAVSCTVAVQVADVRTPTATQPNPSPCTITGTVFMSGAKPAAVAPVITRAFETDVNGVVTPGTAYTLRIEAHDPNASPTVSAPGITFDWKASAGTLGTPNCGPTNAADTFCEVVWTAPSPLTSGMNVTAKLTDTATPSLTTTKVFNFASNDPCFGKANGAACVGTDPCQVNMTCQSGVCQGGSAKVCTASDPCHDAGVCNHGDGSCSNPPSASTKACDKDGLACTVGDHCDGAGLCVAGAPKICNTPPNAFCYLPTSGACVEPTGTCSYTANTGATCSVANAATKCAGSNTFASFACDVSGACMGQAPTPCTSTTCMNGGTCSAATGTCAGGTPQNPGATCTEGATDICQNYTCVAGACTGASKCVAGQSCDTGGVCHDFIVAPQAAKDLGISLGGLAINKSGNAYVSGSVYQPVKTFDSINVTSNGDADVFLAKYDPTSHTALFAKNFGDAAAQSSNSVAVANNGANERVAVVGQFSGTLAMGNSVNDPQSYSINFLAVTDANLTPMSVMAFDLGTAGNLLSVAGNVNSNLVAVCGYSNQAATQLVPGATFNGGTRDLVIAAYDVSTNPPTFKWAKQLGDTTAANSSDEECDAVTVDDAGNVWAVGKYGSTAGASNFNLTGAAFATTPPAGARWLWVAKFDGQTGAGLEQANFGTGAGTKTPTSIAVDANLNVAIGGNFGGSLPFEHTLATAGGSDAFVAKLDASLAPVWSVRLGGTGSDTTQGVAFDSFGDVIATGFFNVTTSGTFSAATLTSEGAADVFVLKLGGATGNTQFAASYGGGGATQSGDKIAVNRWGTGSNLNLVDFAGTVNASITFPPPAGSFSVVATDGFLTFSDLR